MQKLSDLETSEMYYFGAVKPENTFNISYYWTFILRQV